MFKVGDKVEFELDNNDRRLPRYSFSKDNSNGKRGDFIIATVIEINNRDNTFITQHIDPKNNKYQLSSNWNWPQPTHPDWDHTREGWIKLIVPELKVGDRVRFERAGEPSKSYINYPYQPRCLPTRDLGESNKYFKGEVIQIFSQDDKLYYQVSYEGDDGFTYKWPFDVQAQSICPVPGWPELIEESKSASKCTCENLWAGCKCGAFKEEQKLLKKK